ncbi:MAG: ABC transporter ATP-binding protein [Leptospiraceae bacterium]|nr:ABC transporter ATP-binding protein [Leptospiraceae bacterium]MCP5484912.1 ABC transporter ATP-binding protein [Spirochaetales bacterium]
MQNKPLFQELKELWRFISARRKGHIGLLFVAIVFASLAEVLSIGAVVPFLAALTAPETIFENETLRPAIKYLGFQKAQEIVLPLTLVFVGAAMGAGGARLLLLWLNTRLSHAIGEELGIEVYRKTLFQPYRVHISKNSSEILNGVGRAKALIAWTIQPIFSMFAGVMIILSILSFLVALDPVVSLSAIGGFGLVYGLIGLRIRKRLERNGEILAEESVKVTKAMYEGLGGIRDILLDGIQDVYCDIYRNSDRKLNRASVQNNFLSGSPRSIIETIGMVLMAGFAYYLFRESKDGLLGALPLLGSLALGAQRILPALQIGFSSWSTMKSGQAYLTDVLQYLRLPLPSHANESPPPRREFQNSIRIENLSFKYDADGPLILDYLNLSIPRGARVGFVGETGSGKSTLLDIIMALLEPSSGAILVDDEPIRAENVRSWQANIGHVPQSIYLSDTTIAENIAFGVPRDEIDFERMRTAAARAQIAKHVEGLRLGYDTVVGERGVRLSGGQRQRIGIARSLYKQASVLIFDEATSALDNETEKAVMEAIEGLGEDLTILMIAHRISTVQKCDMIVELKNGRIQRIGNYQELFA